MECKFAFVCDFAQRAGGKLHAIGIGWDTIYAPTLPVVHATMCFVAVLQGTIAESGTKRVVLRLIDDDGENVIEPMEQQIPFEIRAPLLHGNMNLTFQLVSLPLTKLGGYAFHLLVQDREITSVRFNVAEPPTTV